VELSNEALQFQHKKHDVTVQPIITYIYFGMHPVIVFLLQESIIRTKCKTSMKEPI